MNKKGIAARTLALLIIGLAALAFMLYIIYEAQQGGFGALDSLRDVFGL